jgi:hypothetical protein
MHEILFSAALTARSNFNKAEERLSFIIALGNFFAYIEMITFKVSFFLVCAQSYDKSFFIEAENYSLQSFL